VRRTHEPQPDPARRRPNPLGRPPRAAAGAIGRGRGAQPRRSRAPPPSLPPPAGLLDSDLSSSPTSKLAGGAAVDAAAAAAPAGGAQQPAAAAAEPAAAAAGTDSLELRLARGERVEVIVSYADAAVKSALAADVIAPVAAAATPAGAGAAPAAAAAAARALASVKARALSADAPAFRDHGARVAAALDALPLSVVSLDNAAALAALRADPAVASVAPSGANRQALAQSLVLMSANDASTHGFQGRGCAVAVLDGGGNAGVKDLGSCGAPGDPAPCRVREAVDITGTGFTSSDLHSTNGARAGGAGVGATFCLAACGRVQPPPRRLAAAPRRPAARAPPHPRRPAPAAPCSRLSVASTIARVAPGADIVLIDVFKGQYAYDRWGRPSARVDKGPGRGASRPEGAPQGPQPSPACRFALPLRRRSPRPPPARPPPARAATSSRPSTGSSPRRRPASTTSARSTYPSATARSAPRRA
jgi:hypothetical protein